MGFVRQSFVRGALVFRDDAHTKRWVDAIGSNVVKYINDFTGGPTTDAGFDSMTEWTITRVEAGASESTITRIDGSGGFLRITTDANDNDGINMQLKESWEVTTDQTLYVGFMGVTLSEATQSDIFMGLSITATDILGGVTDSIGFRKVDASTSVGFLVEKDSTETLSAGVSTMDTSSHDYEFFWDGATSELKVFVDGVEKTAPALTNLPNDEALALSLHCLAGSTTAKTFDFDCIRCIQIGR